MRERIRKAPSPTVLSSGRAIHYGADPSRDHDDIRRNHRDRAESNDERHVIIPSVAKERLHLKPCVSKEFRLNERRDAPRFNRQEGE